MENTENIVADVFITEEGEEINMNNDVKKLTRSRSNRVICGVCGGVGEYFGIDATIIRLLFVFFGCTGTGILAYFIAAAIIPNEE